MHLRLIVRVFFLLAGICSATLSHAQENPTHVALVIGNSKYEAIPELINPMNDAEDMSVALSEAGYVVDTVLDADFAAMRSALDRFSNKATRSEVALIFFAGHGIEVQKNNYLIPIDATLESGNQVAFQAIPLDMMLTAVAGASRLKLVLLDACRNNPFLKNMRRSGTASRSTLPGGLAAIEPDTGTLVGYAAKEGTTASDGVGRNSPYTSAWLKYIKADAIDVGRMFRKVRDDVLKSTGQQQQPFRYGSLPGTDIFLTPQADKAPETDEGVSVNNTATQPSPTSQVQSRNAEARIAWDAVKDSKQREDYQIIVSEYDGTIYSKLAANRIKALDAQANGSSGSGSTPAVTSPTPPVQQQQKWFMALYQNLDFFGADLVEKGLSANSPEQCGAYCGSNTACRAFTFNAQSNRCFLKSGYSFSQVFNGAVSGYFYRGASQAEAPQVEPEWEVFAKADISGNDLGDSRDQSFDQCMARCGSDYRCNGFAFVHITRKRQCWLKANTGQPIFSRNARGGITSAKRVTLTVAPYSVSEVSNQK